MNLFEECLKTVLLEYKDTDIIPFRHDDSAFTVGDILYMKVRRARKVTDTSELKPDYPGDPVDARKTETRVISGKITSISNGMLTVDTFTKPVSIKDPKIMATEAWDRAFRFATQNKREAAITPTTVSFSYEKINGVLCVVMSVQNRMKLKTYDTAYPWNELMNNEKIHPISINKPDSIYLFLPINQSKPIKTKNPPEGAKMIKPEWCLTMGSGDVITEFRFRAFKTEYWREILNACPWLSEIEAFWALKDGGVIKCKPELRRN